jgi:hypothetical protein
MHKSQAQERSRVEDSSWVETATVVSNTVTRAAIQAGCSERLQSVLGCSGGPAREVATEP